MARLLTICLLVAGAESFLHVSRSSPLSVSRTRSASKSAVSMVFGKKEDPWEAMKKRGAKELNSGSLNDSRDDPYLKNNRFSIQRAAAYRTDNPLAESQTAVKNKRAPPRVRASSQRQLGRGSGGGRPGVSVAAGMGTSKRGGARSSAAVSNDMYATTEKRNRFGNKSAANLGNAQFADISDQDEAGFLSDSLAGFFYDKSVGGPQRDLESVIATQLFFATFVLTPIGLYFLGIIEF